MSHLLQGLNEAQVQAVRFGEGPLLVLAGPGSGKTRVITHRVASLIEDRGVSPKEILAVTFTNKAAAEMRERIGRLVVGPPPIATTFHSFAARTLRRHAARIERTARFTILDQRDRLRLIGSLLTESGEDLDHFPPSSIEHRISQLKSDLVDLEEFESRRLDSFDEVVAKVFATYEERLKAQNSLDFDDLLARLARLLRDDEEARTRLGGMFRYVLVDEYQDTNLAQYAIARGLSSGSGNLCVTGDPDQSIYGWRGANLENILQFEHDFPGATVVRLERNYRSTGNILSAADGLIRHNFRRKAKDLVTDNPRGAPVRVYCFSDERSEAMGIADLIRQSVDEGRRRYRDFAVFLRMVSLSRPFEEIFRARHIPFQVIGGTAFYERKEIRDALAFARLALNPADDAAFERIVNVPPRGIGDVSVRKLSENARARGVSRLAALEDLDSICGIRGKPRAALETFGQAMKDAARAVELPPDEAIETILDLVGYRRACGDDEEGHARLAALQELVASAHAFREANPDAALADFLESVSLASDADQIDGASDKVKVMTLHSAKGLEFPVVFLAAFEHDVLPHERAVQAGHEEEERRLAFVGITRAREELSISYAATRFFQGRQLSRAPSRFLEELPATALDRRDVGASRAAALAADPFGESQEPPDFEPVIQIRDRGSAPSPADLFRIGMVVRHHEYGPGTILQIDGVGPGRKATIHFATAGTRRFVLSKAALQPAAAGE